MTADLGIIQAQNQGQRCRLLEAEDIRLNIDNITLFYNNLVYSQYCTVGDNDYNLYLSYLAYKYKDITCSFSRLRTALNAEKVLLLNLN
jgi:hypothetical protein